MAYTFAENMKPFRATLVLLASFLLSGCGFVHDEHITGPYRLIAVDIDEQMSVSCDLGDGSAIGRINETVFSYGFNQRYIVAKQHPEGDRSITKYYFLDMTKDSKYADPSMSVFGPFSQAEFEAESQRLDLPAFSRTLEHLK